MSPEQRSLPTQRDKNLRFIQYIIYIGLAVQISKFAFSFKSSRRIKEKAGKKCENCGRQLSRQEQIASHRNHSRESPHYDHPKTGRCLCPFCEMSYHYQNKHNPGAIGMTPRDNKGTVISWFNLLPEEEKQEALRKYGEQFKKYIRYRDR